MTRAKRTHKISLADAHGLFRRGLCTLVSAEPDMEIIGEASDAEVALASASHSLPDVMVFDLGLLRKDPQAVAALRQFPHSTAILLLATEESQECLELTLATGARGYMLKNTSPSQLVSGIRQAATLEDKDSRGISRLIPDLQALARTEQSYARNSPLTVREQEVMTLLAEGRTVREVARELALSVKTIEAHKLNLMRKLDIHNRASLIDYAMRNGLISAQPTSVAS